MPAVGIGGVSAAASVVLWAAVLSTVDLRVRRLPNELTLGGAGLILLGAAHCGRAVPALLGGAALAGLYLVIHLLDPTALGGGDVKLALGLGALTGGFGVPVWALGALGAPILTAAAGLILLSSRGGTASVTIPHGPSMCVASLAAVALAAW